MFKLVFFGAGSTTFVKNVIGDMILTPELGTFEAALYDIDLNRLDESYELLTKINTKYNGKAVIKKYTDLKEAVKGADFGVNAVQVGGYKPSTVIDFEIPKKYGLRQTIADTLGIGGIFRALRTLPVMENFAEEIKKSASSDFLFLNYTNPMAILTGELISNFGINAVGLCHSVQACVPHLLHELGMTDIDPAKTKWKIAGINHQAWLLEIKDETGRDLYPEIKSRAVKSDADKVRFDILAKFGYYNTESSEHTAEYLPYYIKSAYPEFIEKYGIPLDEYPRRCVAQIEGWEVLKKTMISEIKHEKSGEYASYIINGVVNNKFYRIHGNIINNGLITNLPSDACVEVPCLIDRNGVNPCYIGKLPEALAALNRTNINVQLLTREAYRTKKKEDVYRAAFLDPHTSSELSMDDIVKMCDELFEAHKEFIPEYK